MKTFEFTDFRDCALKILLLSQELEIKPFKDPNFPPYRSSIFDARISKAYDSKIDKALTSIQRKRRVERVTRWQSLVWKRPKDMYIDQEGQHKLFKKIKADDIEQGSLGDCYILACISALAQQPHRIKNMFAGYAGSEEEDLIGFYLQPNEQEFFKEIGMYCVYLYISGQLR